MNNLTSFTKGLIMFAASLIASAVAANGMPATSSEWIVFGITTLGSTLVYIAKNAVFPSVSLYGSINLKDVLSGLILAIGSGLSEWVGTLVAGTIVTWHSLLAVTGTFVATYFAKNFITQNPKP